MNDTTWFWQIVDAHGLAEFSSDETVALREILNRSHRFESEIEAISAAIGSTRFMDPPDGGDVSLAEQVRRMRAELEAKESRLAALENGPAVLADATSNPPLSDLSSLRKGAEDMREALRKIAFLRPAGPTRNKLAMQMERIAIDALGGPGEAARSALVSGSREEQA